jgi:hypothetical protein
MANMLTIGDDSELHWRESSRLAEELLISCRCTHYYDLSYTFLFLKNLVRRLR